MGFLSQVVGVKVPFHFQTASSRSRLRATLDSMMKAGSSSRAPTDLTKSLVPMPDREPNRTWNVDNAAEVTRPEISWDYRSSNSEASSAVSMARSSR